MPPVKIYTLSTCGHCKNAKRFLDDNDVRYDCVDVDLLQGEEREKVIDEVKQINSRLSFPTIVIGDTIIVGFKEDQISEALGL
jgi:glutaredoxin